MHKDMEKNVIRLDGDACYEITLRNAGLGYKETSKLKGQTYSRYSYNGVIFNVNDSLGFKDALAENDLSVVKLVETTWQRDVINEDGSESKKEEKGYEFESFLHESDIFAREVRRAKHAATLAAIKRIAEAEVLDAEGMKALLSASKF
jgi:hypothetical protein